MVNVMVNVARTCSGRFLSSARLDGRGFRCAPGPNPPALGDHADEHPQPDGRDEAATSTPTMLVIAPWCSCSRTRHRKVSLVLGYDGTLFILAFDHRGSFKRKARSHC